MRRQQNITLILEGKGTIFHSAERLVPFAVRYGVYEGRKVMEAEFRAFDCYFLPGGNVAVNLHHRREVPVFECRDVLEIRTQSGIIKNRLMCPKCHYVSLRTGESEQIPGTTRSLIPASCTRKQCGATTTFEG